MKKCFVILCFLSIAAQAKDDPAKDIQAKDPISLQSITGDFRVCEFWNRSEEKKNAAKKLI